MSGENGDSLDCLVGVRIVKAWVEPDTLTTSKLCVRYSKDTGAETFGCFRNTDKIVASDFLGLLVADAHQKFRSIVYPNAKHEG